jgi:hypothetical protein
MDEENEVDRAPALYANGGLPILLGFLGVGIDRATTNE